MEEAAGEDDVAAGHAPSSGFSVVQLTANSATAAGIPAPMPRPHRRRVDGFADRVGAELFAVENGYRWFEVVPTGAGLHPAGGQFGELARLRSCDPERDRDAVRRAALALRLSQLRAEARLSSEQLAAAAGLDPGYYQGLEAGRADLDALTLDHLHDLAVAFGIPTGMMMANLP